MASLVRTTNELETVCAEIRADGLVSLDTEFVWKSTYRPQLGLVQMGSRSRAWAVDCRSALDTTALKSLIEDESVVKILHDARQDLQHLRHWTGAMPVNVFDTQLAAAFAGFPAGLGLQKLLVETIGVELPKTETLTDWLRRPLTDAQLSYALDDVKYLAELKDALVARADKLGTLEWMFEDQIARENPSFFEDVDPEESWKRIRLRRTRLDPHGRAILKSVAALREREARRLDLPRNWLGDDGSLVHMAETHRVNRLVHRLKGAEAEMMRSLYGREIERALSLPREECPADPNRYYIREVLEAADEAIAYLDARAAELHVDPTVIANRAMITAFVDDCGDEENPLASGWRYETVGEEIARRFAVS